ncbi:MULTISPECIES: cysteine hydrolase family protein [unclassified Pseudomonas]|uniref:cysteine hydrolase family protein n=1 Tax=unclassified Pseudomonas TaxID=196821 RepID=UPI0025D0CBE5|nr:MULTISPECIES: cysteine hydrolase family protein [unclassified Pseudomonas]
MPESALIVIDIQNDYFPGGKWALSGADAAADNAVRVIQATRDAGDPIIHVRHESTRADAPFFAPGSEGAKFHPRFTHQGQEPVVLKHFANAFRDTGLKQLLDQHGVEHLVLIGSMSHMCIDATTRAAVDLGYTVRVIHDACATRDLTFEGTTVPAAHVQAAFMAALAFAYAQVICTDDFLPPLAGSRP